MKYMGSKNRIGGVLCPIITKFNKEYTSYVEPFVGGGNMLDKMGDVHFKSIIANDINYYLIKALEYIRDFPEKIPQLITEDYYENLMNDMRTNTTSADDWLYGYVGFSMSFGGKWFGGYRRDEKDSKGDMQNMINQSRRSYESAKTQSKFFQGVDFYNVNYWDVPIPPKSIIYCDPPYENTTSYNSTFDHAKFWEWCRSKSKDGHLVYISEYNAPDDFECLKEIEVETTLSSQDQKKDIEKLFIAPFHGLTDLNESKDNHKTIELF